MTPYTPPLYGEVSLADLGTTALLMQIVEMCVCFIVVTEFSNLELRGVFVAEDVNCSDNIIVGEEGGLSFIERVEDVGDKVWLEASRRVEFKT